jgi:hypothetical protein
VWNQRHRQLLWRRRRGHEHARRVRERRGQEPKVLSLRVSVWRRCRELRDVGGGAPLFALHRAVSVTPIAISLKVGHVLASPDDVVVWHQNFSRSRASKPACGTAFVPMASASSS